MSVRLRSTVGAVLGGIGVFLALGGLLFLRTWLFWAGAALAGCGVALVAWALRDVSRQLGSNQARFEAMLRAEVPQKREQKPPDGR